MTENFQRVVASAEEASELEYARRARNAGVRAPAHELVTDLAASLAPALPADGWYRVIPTDDDPNSGGATP